MSLKDSWLREEVTQEHRASVERAAFLEMDKAHGESKYLWRLLVALVPAGSALMAFFWNRRSELSQTIEDELAIAIHLDDEIEVEDLEFFEDFDLVDVLEEMEEWNS